jgi:hypothetical protein
MHLNRSNGSAQSRQRHSALHGVEPNRLISAVRPDLHCGQTAGAASRLASRSCAVSGGAIP